MLTQHGARLKYATTDVSDWGSLQSLFNAAIDQHKRVDHVFAAAAIPGFRADYLTETLDPETGELQEPSADVFNINLRGCINTAYLALYHMRHQSPAEGSIVLAASAAVLLRFRNSDYNAAKSGLVGFMRGLVPLLNEHSSNFRLNCISPSWTRSGMLDLYPPDNVGYAAQVQDTEVVARSVVLLMADGKRHGQNIYIRDGKFWEMEEDLLQVTINTKAEVHEDVVSLSLCFLATPFMIVSLTDVLLPGPESNSQASGRGGGQTEPQGSGGVAS